MTTVYPEHAGRVTRSSGSQRASTLEVPSGKGSKRASGSRRASSGASQPDDSFVASSQPMDISTDLVQTAPMQIDTTALVAVTDFNEFVKSNMQLLGQMQLGLGTVYQKIAEGAQGLNRVDAKVGQVESKVSSLTDDVSELKRVMVKNDKRQDDLSLMQIKYGWSREGNMLQTARRFLAIFAEHGAPTVASPRHLNMEHPAFFLYEQAGEIMVAIHPSELSALQKETSLQVLGTKTTEHYDNLKSILKLLSKLDATSADFITTTYLFDGNYGVAPFEIKQAKKSEKSRGQVENARALQPHIANLIRSEFRQCTDVQLKQRIDTYYRLELTKMMRRANAQEDANAKRDEDDNEDAELPEGWEEDDKFDLNEDQTAELDTGVEKLSAEVERLIKLNDTVQVIKFSKLLEFYRYFALDLKDLDETSKLYDVTAIKPRAFEQKMGRSTNLVHRQEFTPQDGSSPVASVVSGQQFCNEVLRDLNWVNVVAALLWNNPGMTVDQARAQAPERHVGAKWQVCDSDLCPILDLEKVADLQLERNERLDVKIKDSETKKKEKKEAKAIRDKLKAEGKPVPRGGRKRKAPEPSEEAEDEDAEGKQPPRKKSRASPKNKKAKGSKRAEADQMDLSVIQKMKEKLLASQGQKPQTEEVKQEAKSDSEDENEVEDGDDSESGEIVVSRAKLSAEQLESLKKKVAARAT